jgi:hypothetical protein
MAEFFEEKPIVPDDSSQPQGMDGKVKFQYSIISL